MKSTEPNNPICPNCGASFDSKFCPSCGQKRIDEHEFAVRHFFGHLLHEITHLDSNKIVRTFAHLVAKPGRLTREYLAGRKGQYINPIRVYLTVSAIYFFFAWGTLAAAGGGGVEQNENRPYMADIARRKGTDAHTLALKVQEKAGKYAGFLRFASVLVSGLFLMLLYRGSGKFYVEHLIFSLHFYAFDFLAKCVVALAYITGGSTAFAVTRSIYYVGTFIYLIFALRAAYAQAWPRTILKAFAQFIFEVTLFFMVNFLGFLLAVLFA